MGEPNAGDVSLASVAIVLDELVASGLDLVCVSPGSRSTPLALASARDGRIAVHVHLDERSAAFFALGYAKATGRMAAVVCTSGTAAANSLPAVVEARQTRTPLVVLSADRPPRLQGVGANQTIDQRELYGGYAAYLEATLPSGEPGSGVAWRALGAAIARAAIDGPVHCNLPFDEPLTPTGAAVDLGDAPEPAGRARPSPSSAPPVAGLAGELGGVERGLVIAGGGADAPALHALATALGWPLIAEPLSGVRAADAMRSGSALLSCEGFLARAMPEVVLQVGAAPTTRAALAVTATVERLVVVQRPGIPADPHRRAAPVLSAPGETFARAMLAAVRPRDAGEWLARWRGADDAAREAIDRTLDDDDEPSEPRLARDLVAALPNGATLVVGSSTPIRDVDLYAAPRGGVRMLGNRGASGIDGFVSTTLGVAVSGARTLALAGDLSMLHDASGLVWSGRREPGAVFVVPNNRGGGIFDLLPQATLPEAERLFVTPHEVDLRALAHAAGCEHRLVLRASALEEALAPARGSVVVEVPIDRVRAGAVRERLRRAIDAAIAQA